jgi:hypothetical protein
MKKILLVMLMLLAISIPKALKADEVTIGDTSSTTTQYTLPVNMFFNYSLTQQIYTADEIGMAGTINSISFEYTNTGSFTMNNVQVYMLNVDKTEFAGTTDMETVTSDDLVYTGTISATGAGWVTITLDSPFEYDGTSNLLICFYDPTSGFPGSAYKWRTTATTSYLGLAYYSDSYTPSLTDVTTFSGSKIRYQYRANIKLDIVPSSGDFCYPVSHFSVTDITENDATVFWTAPENANGYILEYKASTMDWDDDDVEVVYPTDTFYTIMGLNANTLYNVRVLHTCSFGNSAYKSLSFKTECGIIPVDNVPYSEGFEGYASYAFPDCWTLIAGYSTTSYDYPYVNNTATPNTGSGSLYFSNNAANPIYVALPAFVDDINTLRVSFWMKPNGTTAAYGRFEVGLMSDLEDTTTFRMVKSWSALEIGSTSWQYYIADFDTVTTTSDDYIVFRRVIDGTSTTTYGWYVDDLKVMPIPACTEPLYLEVVSVTNNSANLTWDGGENTNFTIYYRSSPDDEYSSQSNATLDEDDIYTLTDLEGNTTYDWYVATVCDDGTEYNSFHSTFTTKCNPFEAPFTENFNANTRPDCWEGFSGLASAVIAGTASLTSSSDWIFTNTNVFGAYHAKINIYGTSKKGWLVTPAIDLSALSTPTLTFDLALTKFNNVTPITPGSQADDKFMVLISTDMGATWSAEDAIVWSNDGNGDYVYDQISTEGEFIAIPLTDYAGETIRIAFYGESTVTGGDNDLHIDNVNVDEAPACLPPTLLTITELTNNAVSLEWEAGDQSSWMVEYDTVGFTPGTGIFVPVSGDPTITISDLASSTEYDIYVMTDCGGTYSISAKKTVTTMCDGIATLPQTWDFDNNLTAGTSTYPLPACWNRIVTASTTLYPYAYNSSTYAHSGTRSLYFYNYYSNALGILPAIDADVFDIQDLQLSFYARCSSTSSYVRLDVGVMTDPTDDSTFTLIQTIPLTTSHPSDPYVVSFSNYTGEGTYIAFRNTSISTSTASNYFYIDDVTLEESPSCSKALYLAAAPYAYSADLTWMAQGEDFDVYYKAASDDEYTEVIDVTLEDGVFTLTGLSASTTYTWYVVTNCDDTVYTSNTATFTTSCAPEMVPFIEDFNAGTTLPNCWGRYSGLASDVFAGGALTSTTSGWLFTNTNVFGEHHPKVNIYGTGCKYWLVTPEIDLSELTEPALTFNLALTDYNNANPIENDSTGQADDKFMVIISTDNGNTWSASNATIWSNDSTGDYVYNQISYTGEEVTISLEDYIGQTIRVAFYGESTVAVTGEDNDLHIDNVVVGEAPSCSAPSQLLVSEIDQTSAVVTWTETGTASSWILEYDTAGFEIGTGNIVTITDGVPTATLSDLEPATSYEVYVQAVCPDGGNSNPASATFRTACVALDEIPQTWNFDGIGTGINVHPDCWICSNTYSSSTQYPYVYGSNAYSGNADLYFYSTTSTYSLAVLPMVDVNTYPINTLQVSFMMRCYTPSSVRMVVGLMTDPGDITTFHPIDTVYNSISGEYEFREVMFNNYDGDAPYVALKMINLSSTTYAYVDDVTIDFIPSCPRPTHLTVTDNSMNSVTLSWDENDASSWEIAYGPVGFDPNSDTATVVAAGTTPFEVPNLDMASTYQFYVRAICAGSDNSPWSLPVIASTDCDVMTLPYSENFDSYTTSSTYSDANGIAPNCWTTFSTNTTYGAPHITSTGSYHFVHSGANCMVFTCGSAGSDAYAALPTFTDDLNTLHLNFWRAMENTSYGTLTVGYVTNINDMANSFVTVATISSVGSSAGDTISVDFTGANIPVNGNICFHWNCSSVFYSCCIDDIVVTSNGSAPVVTDPTVATGAASAIGQTTATLNGTISNPSNVTITACGFEWKAVSDADYTVVTLPSVAATMTHNLTGLTANTNYTYKAFITFNGTTVYGDDVNFTTAGDDPQTCNVPTNLTATATAYNAADVNWTAGGTETSWNLQYKAASATEWGNSIVANATTYHISGLNAETEYQVRVQAVCSATSSSEWTAPVNFTTPVEPVDPCDAPTGLTVTNITHNSATVSWTAGGDETAWSVQYKSDDASQWQEANVQTTSHTIEGLNPQTHYAVRVKAVCAPGNESGFLNGDFTTNPDAIDNITLAQSINLMPNPADNYIDLRINSNVNVKEAVVYNAFGQMVQTVELNDNYARIDLNNMASGMYFVRVNGDNMTATKKFIKR